MTAFQYDAGIIERFPHVTGGVLLATGMTNGPSPGGLREAFEAEQRRVLERIGDTALSELETLAAWRSAFREFGVNPTKSRSAPEALLRRLTKKGDVPSINALVDIGNLVSIRYGLPTAVFDTRAVTSTVTVRFAEGNERYTPLGGGEVEHPEPGEVAFVDEADMVVARRWCWRQSDESAARADTTEAIIVAEAVHQRGHGLVREMVEDLYALLREYVGGEYEVAVLDKEQPGV